MGRLVESRQNGIFSHGGLLGRGDFNLYRADDGTYNYQKIYERQYDAYLKKQTFSEYGRYGSQSGMQAMFFGALDKLSPFTPVENMRIYRVITSLTFALVIGYLLFWFLTEFGWTAALLALVTTIASPWLTLFGRNLFYFPTFFYIPIVAVTFYLNRHSAHIEQVKLKFGGLIFITVLLKCLFNGYDFILPSILMIGAPFVYYAMRDNWGTRKFIQTSGIIIVSVTAAVLVSLLVLTVQLWANQGSFAKATEYIISTFNRRTMGDPQSYPGYTESLQANVWDVLWIYLQTNWAVVQTGLRFMDLIFIFAGFTLIYFIKEKFQIASPEDSRKIRAMIVATWASIFSPLLWYVIFKGQAYVHTHTNFLAWYMPFTIYGFALCGCVLQNLFASAKKN